MFSISSGKPPSRWQVRHFSESKFGLLPKYGGYIRVVFSRGAPKGGPEGPGPALGT